MKTLLFLTLAASAGHALAESAIPQPYHRDRYEETVADSPFALATKPPGKEPEAEPVNVLTNLYITGITQLDGKDYITVRDVSGESFKLVGNAPLSGDDSKNSPYIGVYAEKVNWSDAWNGVSVTLRHGTQFKREGVRFKEIAQPVPGQTTSRNPPQKPGTNNLGPRPLPVSSPGGATTIRGIHNPAVPRPTGPPRMGGQFPGAGSSSVGTKGGSYPTTPNTGGTRLRDRGPIPTGR